MIQVIHQKMLMFFPKYFLNALTLVALSVVMLATFSCKKTVEKELEREEERMIGKWTVSSLRTVVTDSMGKTLVDSTVENQGTVEFQPVGDAFRPALFEGGCARSELVDYFRGKAAGDATTNGGWGLY